MRGAIRKWTEAAVESALRDMVATMGAFPSASDMRRVGRNDLACAVSKSGGYQFWAERIGVSRKFSDSDFGWAGEDSFCALCQSQGLAAIRTGEVKSPWDIEVEGILRVDVKTSSLHTYRSSSGWYYRIGKRAQSDLVVLLQSDTGDFYSLPWWMCPTTNITISRGGGKYAAYLNNWPLIRQMLGMRLAERARLSGERLAEVA